MAELILVRHAQASLFGADYDALSPLGREQARALGRHFATHGARFARVYVGPRRRHRETLALVAEAFAGRGLPWPAAAELAELDEHAGLEVARRTLAQGGDDPGARLRAAADDAERAHLVREFFDRYFEILRDWARGSVAVEGVEPWREFRARSRRALDLLCAGPGPAVAFTSGGLVASAAGWLLGLDEERVIGLSAVLRNTALSEVRYSATRRSLVSFNALPHLPAPGAATAV